MAPADIKQWVVLLLSLVAAIVFWVLYLEHRKTVDPRTLKRHYFYSFKAWQGVVAWVCTSVFVFTLAVIFADLHKPTAAYE